MMNVHDRVGVTNARSGAASPEGLRGDGGVLRRALGVVNRHRMLIAGLVLLVLAVGAYNIFGGTTQPEGEPIIVEAERGDVENVVTAVGNLQPLKFVDVGAQVSGQLKTLHVAAGDEVKAGQLLAEIDATVQTSRVESARAQMQNLQAQLNERQAQLQLAATQAKRQESLLAIGGTSQDLVDGAQASLKSAQAQVRATQAQIAQSRSTLQGDEATLGYSRIYAPIAGTVSSITAREGQTLNANQQAPTILQIADLSVMTVSAQVSEADVQRLTPGMQAYFTTLGNPQRRWTGKLRQILPTPQVVNNVVMYTALFEVENPNKELMTQMTAQVFFVISASYDVVTVPVSALRYTDRGARGARPAGDGNAREAAAPNAARGGAQTAARGQGGGRGEFRRRGGAEGINPEGRMRPAMVTVVSDSGAQVERAVRVGVSDRIKAEVASGLEEGEQVVAGTLAREDDEEGGGGGRGGGGGGGGFGGRGFGVAP
jgi:macrolide-specific efflux system membrane fusion protein